MTQTVHVALADRSYDIDIGGGLLGEAGRRLAQSGTFTHAVVITDGHVAAIYEDRLEAWRPHFRRFEMLVVEPGESAKSVANAERLWEQLLACGADRHTLVVALGGGVVGDLAGFVAATFARGLPFAQVPTTLLAQVDSSVGGKVGVNLPNAKNMVGAFWQPAVVLIDTETLTTLPDREYRAGLAEVVKYGVILDAEFFAYLEKHSEAINASDPEVLETVIARCCRLKADVVEDDERELTGKRAVLNYGHTFAHAFESLTGYSQLLHGEAVALGMHCAARLAELLGRVDAEFTRRQQELLAALRLPTHDLELDPDAVLRAMQRDKKVAHGKLRFVLPTRLGHVELVSDVDPQAVRAALAPTV